MNPYIRAGSTLPPFDSYKLPIRRQRRTKHVLLRLANFAQLPAAAVEPNQLLLFWVTAPQVDQRAILSNRFISPVWVDGEGPAGGLQCLERNRQSPNAAKHDRP